MPVIDQAASAQELTIPWKDAKTFGEAHGCDQIVVWGYASGKGQCLATWGKSVQDADQAAQGGNHIKTALLGWPAGAALALPNRVILCHEALLAAKRGLEIAEPSRSVRRRNDVLASCLTQVNEALALFNSTELHE